MTTATAFRLYIFDMSRPKGDREILAGAWCAYHGMRKDAAGEYVRGTQQGAEAFIFDAELRAQFPKGRGTGQHITPSRLRELGHAGPFRAKFYHPEMPAEWSDFED